MAICFSNSPRLPLLLLLRTGRPLGGPARASSHYIQPAGVVRRAFQAPRPVQSGGHRADFSCVGNGSFFAPARSLFRTLLRHLHFSERNFFTASYSNSYLLDAFHTKSRKLLIQHVIMIHTQASLLNERRWLCIIQVGSFGKMKQIQIKEIVFYFPISHTIS